MEVSVHQSEIHIVVFVLHNTQAILAELSCQQAMEVIALIHNLMKIKKDLKVSVLKDVCHPNPCQNGGQCVQSGSYYNCICPPTYTGTQCTQLVAPPSKIFAD